MTEQIAKLTENQILFFTSVVFVSAFVLIWYIYSSFFRNRLPRNESKGQVAEQEREHSPSTEKKSARVPKARPAKRPQTAPNSPSTALMRYEGNPDPDPNQELPDYEEFDESAMYGGHQNHQSNGLIGEIRHVPAWILLVIALITRFFIQPPFLGHRLWDWRWQTFFALCVAGVWYYRRIHPNSRDYDASLNWAILIWSLIIVFA